MSGRLRLIAVIRDRHKRPGLIAAGSETPLFEIVLTIIEKLRAVRAVERYEAISKITSKNGACMEARVVHAKQQKKRMLWGTAGMMSLLFHFISEMSIQNFTSIGLYLQLPHNVDFFTDKYIVQVFILKGITLFVDQTTPTFCLH